MLCRDTDAADLLSTTNSLFQLKNMIIRNKKEVRRNRSHANALGPNVSWASGGYGSFHRLAWLRFALDVLPLSQK